jgi:hypothetical protein
MLDDAAAQSRHGDSLAGRARLHALECLARVDLFSLGHDACGHLGGGRRLADAPTGVGSA